MLFSSNVQIILSKNKVEYPENKIIKLNFENEIGEGSYGIVYKSNNYAIKIFKNCTLGHIDLSSNEPELFPKNNENRELLFYFELLKKNMDIQKQSIHHILQPYAIGILKEDVKYSIPKFDQYNRLNTQLTNSIKIENSTYFVILPLCIPFYKVIPVKNNDLIKVEYPNNNFINIINNNSSKIHFGVYFVLNIMKYLSIASIYLEDEFKIYNLDFKINNIMFLKNNSCKSGEPLEYEALIVLDFGLIKHAPNINKIIHNNNNNSQILNHSPTFESSIFDYSDSISQKYFIWPYSGTALVSQVPSYSICIIGLELLFGKKEVEKLPSYRIARKLIDKMRLIDNSLYNLFYEGVITKINTKKLLSYILKYIE
jgi:hypothetical protein